MNNSNDNKDKVQKLYLLNFVASVCFYICALIHFINRSNNIAIIYMTLGSAFLCLGGVNMNKSRKK